MASSSLAFEVEAAVFHAALKKVSSLSKGGKFPVLSCVLISVHDDGKASVMTTDLSMWARAEFAVTSSASGDIMVNTGILENYLHKLPKGSIVSFAHKGGAQATISTGRSKMAIMVLDPADFPEAKSIEGEPVNISLTASEFSKLFGVPLHAASTEPTRYYLNGIHMHPYKGELRSVATDGHRLAMITLRIDGAPAGVPEFEGIIIPRETVGILLKMFDGAKGVILGLSKTLLSAQSDGMMLISKLIDGTFPDYERVIPARSNMMMNIDRSSFSSAVDRVVTVSTERTRAVKLSVSSGQVVVSVRDADHGTAEEDVPATYEGDAIELGANSKYLNELLKLVEGETCSLFFTSPGSPIVIQDDKHAKDRLFLIMPMRV